MQVFGHDDVADDAEMIAGADFLENLHGEISGASGSEKGSSLVAAEGDEVKVAASGDALERFGRRREEGPTLCLPTAGRQRAQREGHPGGAWINGQDEFVGGLFRGLGLRRQEGGE